MIWFCKTFDWSGIINRCSLCWCATKSFRANKCDYGEDYTHWCTQLDRFPENVSEEYVLPIHFIDEKKLLVFSRCVFVPISVHLYRRRRKSTEISIVRIKFLKLTRQTHTHNTPCTNAYNSHDIFLLLWTTSICFADIFLNNLFDLAHKLFYKTL